jgi:hypothetical protein
MVEGTGAVLTARPSSETTKCSPALILLRKSIASTATRRRRAGGKNCSNKRANRSIKEVLAYPLTPRFG